MDSFKPRLREVFAESIAASSAFREIDGQPKRQLQPLPPGRHVVQVVEVSLSYSQKADYPIPTVVFRAVMPPYLGQEATWSTAVTTRNRHHAQRDFARMGLNVDIPQCISRNDLLALVHTYQEIEIVGPSSTSDQRHPVRLIQAVEPLAAAYDWNRVAPETVTVKRAVDLPPVLPVPPGTDPDLWGYLNLYLALPRLTDYAEEPEDETWRALTSKSWGLPVTVGCSRRFVSHMPGDHRLDSFFNAHSPFYMIPCEVPDGSVAGFVLRSVEASEYRDIRAEGAPPTAFGWYAFNTFRRGQPIIVCEGIKDALFLQELYPFTLAMLGAHIPLSLYNLLTHMTNHIIVAYDHDERGDIAAQELHASLKHGGGAFARLAPPPGLKDWGEGFGVPGAEDALVNRLNTILKSWRMPLPKFSPNNAKRRVV